MLVQVDWCHCRVTLGPAPSKHVLACADVKTYGLALVDTTTLWGFVLHYFAFPLSGLDSGPIRVSPAQLHPLLVARFPLEVAGVEF